MKRKKNIDVYEDEISCVPINIDDCKKQKKLDNAADVNNPSIHNNKFIDFPHMIFDIIISYLNISSEHYLSLTCSIVRNKMIDLGFTKDNRENKILSRTWDRTSQQLKEEGVFEAICEISDHYNGRLLIVGGFPLQFVSDTLEYTSKDIDLFIDSEDCYKNDLCADSCWKNLINMFNLEYVIRNPTNKGFNINDNTNNLYRGFSVESSNTLCRSEDGLIISVTYINRQDRLQRKFSDFLFTRIDLSFCKIAYSTRNEIFADNIFQIYKKKGTVDILVEGSPSRYDNFRVLNTASRVLKYADLNFKIINIDFMWHVLNTAVIYGHKRRIKNDMKELIRQYKKDNSKPCHIKSDTVHVTNTLNLVNIVLLLDIVVVKLMNFLHIRDQYRLSTTNKILHVKLTCLGLSKKNFCRELKTMVATRIKFDLQQKQIYNIYQVLETDLKTNMFIAGSYPLQFLFKNRSWTATTIDIFINYTLQSITKFSNDDIYHDLFNRIFKPNGFNIISKEYVCYWSTMEDIIVRMQVSRPQDSFTLQLYFVHTHKEEMTQKSFVSGIFGMFDLSICKIGYVSGGVTYSKNILNQVKRINTLDNTLPYLSAASQDHSTTTMIRILKYEERGFFTANKVYAIKLNDKLYKK